MSKKKKLLWGIASFLLAVLTIRMVFKFSKGVSVSRVIDAVIISDKRWLFLGVVASAMYVWLEGVALRIILNAAGHKTSNINGLLYSTSDIYFSAITPSATGGQPASAFFMIRDGISVGVTTAALVLNLMMYTIAIVVLGIIAIIIKPSAFIEFSGISKALIIIGFIVLSVLSLIFFLILKEGKRFFRKIEELIFALNKKGIIKDVKKLISRLKKAGDDYGKCLDLIEGNNKMVLKVFVCAFFQRASQIVVPMLLFISLGGKLKDAPLIISKQCLMTIGYNFVPIPGAMGVSDYLMLDGFTRVMERVMAFRIEMLSRGITFYICVALSGIITLIGYIAGKDRNHIVADKQKDNDQNVVDKQNDNN